MRGHPTIPKHVKLPKKFPTQLLLHTGKFLSIEDDLNYGIAFSTYNPDLLELIVSTLIDTKNHSALETLLIKLLSTDLRIPSLRIFTELANNHSLPHSLTLLAAHVNYKSKALNQKTYWKSRDPFPTTTAEKICALQSENITPLIAQASSENLNAFIGITIQHIQAHKFLRLDSHHLPSNLNKIITHILLNRSNDIDTKHLDNLTIIYLTHITRRLYDRDIDTNLQTTTELLHRLYNTLKRQVGYLKTCDTFYKTTVSILNFARPPIDTIRNEVDEDTKYGASHISHLVHIIDKPNEVVNETLCQLHRDIIDQHLLFELTDTAFYREIVSLLRNRAQLQKNSIPEVLTEALSLTHNLPNTLAETLSRNAPDRSERLKITLLAMIRVATPHSLRARYQHNEQVSQLISFHQLYLEHKQQDTDFNPNHDQVIKALIKTLDEITKHTDNDSNLCQIVDFAHGIKELLLSSNQELTPRENTISLDELIKLYISLSQSVMLCDEEAELLKIAIHLCATHDSEKETLSLLENRIKQYNALNDPDDLLTKYIYDTIQHPSGEKVNYKTITMLISVIDSSLLNQDIIINTISPQLKTFYEQSTDSNPLELIQSLQTLLLALSDHQMRLDVGNTLLSLDNIKRRSCAYRILPKIPSFFATQATTEIALAYMAKNIQSTHDVTLLYSLIREMHPRQYAPYINQIIAASLPLSYPQACQAVTIMRDGVKYLPYFEHLKLQTLFKRKEYNETFYSFKISILELLQNARNPMSNGDFIFARKIQSCYRKHLENRDQSMPTLTPIEDGTFSQLMEYWASDLSWDRSNRKALIRHQYTLPSKFRSLSFRELCQMIEKNFNNDHINNHPQGLGQLYHSNTIELGHIRVQKPSIRESVNSMMKRNAGPLIACLAGFVGSTVWSLTPILTILPQWGVITNSVFASLSILATLVFSVFFAIHTAYDNEALTRYKRFISQEKTQNILKTCTQLHGFFNEHPEYSEQSNSRADCSVLLAVRDPDAQIATLGLNGPTNSI